MDGIRSSMSEVQDWKANREGDQMKSEVGYRMSEVAKAEASGEPPKIAGGGR
jgi:hypothetical protein